MGFLETTTSDLDGFPSREERAGNSRRLENLPPCGERVIAAAWRASRRAQREIWRGRSPATLLDRLTRALPIVLSRRDMDMLEIRVF